jgi:cytosine/creatinine deaminase
VARALLPQLQSYLGHGETVRLDLAVERGRIARITPAGGGGGGPPVDLDGGMVWPCFTDIQTHLDKGHIWPRSSNPDGRHASARTAVAADRTAHWSAADVAARMRFGLRCAYAHGTRAVRTHINSYGEQGEISCPSRGQCARNGKAALRCKVFR